MSFFLFVIIASLIHSFSILFVFIYFVKFIPLLNKKWDVLLFLICLCLPVVKVNIVNQISTLLDIGHLSNYSLAYGETGLVVNKVNPLILEFCCYTISIISGKNFM